MSAGRGSKIVGVSENEITPQMLQTLNQTFGLGTWTLYYGFDSYEWFTRYSQTLLIELKNQHSLYYDFFLANDGNLF
ncbi:MAG: hypothetical protein R2822_30995 [Spirosomataceae bacterium]